MQAAHRSCTNQDIGCVLVISLGTLSDVPAKEPPCLVCCAVALQGPMARWFGLFVLFCFVLLSETPVHQDVATGRQRFYVPLRNPDGPHIALAAMIGNGITPRAPADATAVNVTHKIHGDVTLGDVFLMNHIDTLGSYLRTGCPAPTRRPASHTSLIGFSYHGHPQFS